MKNKFLKFLSIILVISLLTPSLVFADSKLIDSIGSQASDINSSEVTGTDISQSQQSQYSDELITFEDNETKVFATKSSYFSVIIPKKVILDGGETNKGDYSVKVKGDIASNEVVTVEPDTSFAFKQKGKLDVVANVTQSITTFQIGDSLVTESNILDGVTTTGTVSVDDISAGSWVGTFKFNIALEHEIESEELEPGLYDADGVMLCTWEESGIDEDCSNARSIINSNSAITKVVIPDSATYIYNGAFFGCTNLTSITIPDSVTSIGNIAFYQCSSLTSITIPEGVTSIGNDAFYMCTGVTSIVVDKNNTVYDSRNNCNAIIETATNTLLYGCDNTIIPEGITSIEESAFLGCTGLTSITIPSSVTSIESYAFAGCTGLTSVEIPDSFDYSRSGGSFFEGCENLTSVTIPVSTYIHPDVFSNCSSLTTLHLTKGTGTMISYDNIDMIDIPWDYCKNSIETITIEEGVTNISNRAFYNCTNLTSITIPDSVTSIGNYAFYNCKNLTSITIPDSVTNIGYEAFSGTGLTSIVIPDSLTNIGNGAFTGCINISVDENNPVYDSRNNCNAIIETSTNTLVSGCKNTIIPNSVTSIGDHAFSGCTGLTSIEIPDGVTSIGDNAFYGCTGLNEIYIPYTVSYIGGGPFIECINLTIYFAGTQHQWDKGIYYADGNNWTRDFTIIYESKYCSGLYDANGVRLCTWEESGIRGDCNNARNVILNNYPTTTKVVLPSNVSHIIGPSAFGGCTTLVSISIPYGIQEFQQIAFAGCTGLTNVTIPDTIRQIGPAAFADCTGLTTINYLGTEEQWNAITFGNDWNSGCPSDMQIVYNYNGS